MKKTFLSLIAFSLLGTMAGHSQILYKVEGKDLKAPSYVFGSHHLSPISIVEESGVMEYFNQADQVVGEIDLTMDPMALSMALQPFMMAPSDSTLSVLLAGEDFDALNQQFQKWAPMPGMQLQMLETLKPMAVSTMVAAGMSTDVMPGFDPNQQLDTYFFKSGVESGKKIMALETPEYQGEVLFNTTPLTVQAEVLVDMLKNPDEAVEAAKKLSEAYKNRDLDSMIELSKEDEKHPEFMEYILYKRNANWMEKLPGIIEETPSFIVVGALHLAGEKGIIEGLKSEGFTVTPIY
ncbi:MAG: TraB/GumN family protein [Muribaculaceae bacterium]|nr:TraB/GumN family protein [Muribaculaceae bacterium]